MPRPRCILPTVVASLHLMPSVTLAGETAEFRVSIDRESGTYDTFRVWTVSDPEEVEEWNEDAHLTVEEAQAKDPGLDLGDTIETLSREYAHWMPERRGVPAAALSRMLRPQFTVVDASGTAAETLPRDRNAMPKRSVVVGS